MPPKKRLHLSFPLPVCTENARNGQGWSKQDNNASWEKFRMHLFQE
jgi:hypothetical protein